MTDRRRPLWDGGRMLVGLRYVSAHSGSVDVGWTFTRASRIALVRLTHAQPLPAPWMVVPRGTTETGSPLLRLTHPKSLPGGPHYSRDPGVISRVSRWPWRSTTILAGWPIFNASMAYV
jgi:hypothetical protein